MSEFNLRQWVKENSIIERTFDGFWYFLNNYMEEEKEEFEEIFKDFDKNKLKLRFKEVRLTIRNWDEEDLKFWERFSDEYNPNYEFIDSLIVVDYEDESGVAEYVMRFSKSGEVLDDFLSS